MDAPAPPLADVTLAMVSWKAPGTLAHTLASYSGADIFGLFGACRIHFNEIADCDRAMAAGHGLTVQGSGKNLGIFGAIDALAEAVSTPYILSVENDCPLVTGRQEFLAMMASALDDMRAYDVPAFSMRSRRTPGQDFERRARYEERFRVVWPIGSDITCRQPMTMLPLRAWEDRRRSRLRGAAIYAEEDPALRHPGVITRSANGNWLTTSAHLNWSNNCILVRTDFLRNVILDRVRRYPARATVNGHQDIEAAIKRGGWWRRQSFPLGQSEPGAFTHHRVDR
jgi:hypothetical protein